MYNCKIIDIVDEETFDIKIGTAIIRGFSFGVQKKVGDVSKVDLGFFDFEIYPCEEQKKSIVKTNKYYSYELYGILDIENAVLKSEIELELDSELLYDYGYLDGNYVRIDVPRIDIDFEPLDTSL